jgi:ketosteroid isomerase-like protein
VEFIQPRAAGGAGLFSAQGGRDVWASWVEWLSTWENHRTEIIELEERGDRILVLTTDHLTGRDGIELVFHGATIYTVRDGRVVRFEVFPDHPENARAAFDAATGEVPT